jgi:hypothetical protein
MPAAELAAAERRCCAFFEFTVGLELEGRPTRCSAPPNKPDFRASAAFVAVGGRDGHAVFGGRSTPLRL